MADELVWVQNRKYRCWYFMTGQIALARVSDDGEWWLCGRFWDSKKHAAATADEAKAAAEQYVRQQLAKGER